MKIDDKTIDKLANLAKLQFNAEEKIEIKKDLENILTFMYKLNEIDTEGVEPLKYITEEPNSLREDKIEVTLSKEKALKNAPQKDSDYIKVPKVLQRN